MAKKKNDDKGLEEKSSPKTTMGAATGKLKIMIPEGVNMRDPKTSKLVKDPERDKSLKAMETSVEDNTFWRRRINAGDVKWLNPPEGWIFQKKHRLPLR